MNMIYCSDKETIDKLKSQGFKVFKEDSNMTQFICKDINKMNFDNSISSKIKISNKMMF